MGANTKTNKGRTPLHIAAMWEASETAKVLLKGGANANAKTNKGRTPLHIAAMWKASEIAKVLLKGEPMPTPKPMRAIRHCTLRC